MGLIVHGNTNPIPIPAFPLKGKEQSRFLSKAVQMENLG